ncbi:MAG TPA: LytTR family DNA-binding domain-containing protein [Usitatibacter sp.]|nr:LytTR family DNA-binding domain-containing protein [Usitatibacter sp.]
MSEPARAVIADDEPLLRESLRAALAQAWPALDIVAEAANGADAVHAVREHRPDLAFLDIEMPVMSGLEAARELRGLAHVVFVTAYDRYAIEAFDRGVVDYVLKPASAERLADTAARLRGRLRETPASLENLIEDLSRRIAPPAPPLQWLQASLGSTIRLINVDDVLYFQSDMKYTRVVTNDSDALVKTPLRELAAQLDARHFWQVHRGTLVNVSAIASVSVDETGRREIALKGRPERLEVSRAFSHLFKQM